MRVKIGWWLRCLADRIDHENAPKVSQWTFTWEDGIGAVFHNEGISTKGHKGCRLLIESDAEYEKAHTDADNHARWMDWKTMTIREAQ